MSIRIYYSNVSCLKNEELFRRLYALMPRERREKIDRLCFDKDKRLSLGAGTLLYRALSEEGIDSAPEVSYGKNGKPYFAGKDDFFFSLSHSSELAMCAVSDKEIGCDAERIGGYDGRIANRFFSKEENEYIGSFEKSADKAAAFFRIWTRKESFLKATGLGFSVSSSSFSVVSNEGASLRQNICSGAWDVYDVVCDLRYRAAFCTEDRESAERAETVKVDLKRDIC